MVLGAATVTSVAVQNLIDAGACVVGKMKTSLVVKKLLRAEVG